jgi:hypothetical protein
VNGFIPTLAALLLAIVPLDLPLTSRVETAEQNIIYDENGKETFRQIIIWQFNRATSREEVRCWWLLKDDSFSGDMLRWDGQVMRRIVAERVRTVHSQCDREMRDRQRLPVEERRGLVKFYKEK